MELDRSYRRTEMQKEIVIQKLRERGCRITKQRLMLLDIILREECSCCKEIHYQASKLNSNIGTATIYRMINILEEIGAISRRNMYRIECEHCYEKSDVCKIEFDDDTILELSACSWNQVVQAGLLACGYAGERRVCKITA